MKRSSLRRYTGLRSSKPLRSSAALRRTGRIAGTPSAAQRRQQAARRAAYAIVRGRSGGQCEASSDAFAGLRCMNAATQTHHRRPRRAGGSTDPLTEKASNCLHVCEAHHATAESKRERAYELGWLVRAGHDPKTVRVLLWCGWVLLDDDGTYKVFDTPTDGE